MSVSDMYTLGQVDLGDGTTIDHIQNANLTPNHSVMVERAAGAPAPCFLATVGVAAEITFETNQVDLVLASAGLYGGDMSAGNTDLYLRQMSDKGTRESGSVHKRLRGAAAFLLVTQIRATRDNPAVASCRLIFQSTDGTTAPLIPAGTVALPTVTLPTTHFWLGPLKTAAGTITGIRDVSLDFNHDVLIETDGAELYPTFVATRTVAPEVNATTTDCDQLESITTVGVQYTSLVQFLREKTIDGTFVADGTSTHIGVSSTIGQLALTSGSADNNGEWTQGFVARAREVSGTAAWVISTATAIT